MKFSCTVYHAAEFEALRRKCDVSDTYIQSLASCDAWQATGGKSSATFFMTKGNCCSLIF